MVDAGINTDLILPCVNTHHLFQVAAQGRKKAQTSCKPAFEPQGLSKTTKTRKKEATTWKQRPKWGGMSPARAPVFFQGLKAALPSYAAALDP